jgi:hypothetical protein
MMVNKGRREPKEYRDSKESQEYEDPQVYKVSLVRMAYPQNY